MVKTLGEIIFAIRDRFKDDKGKTISQTKFGLMIGLDERSAQSNISQYELNKTQPPFETIVKILSLIEIDLIDEINSKLSDNQEDPHVVSDLIMTRHILKSDTRYASDLSSNIHGFFEAVENVRRLEDNDSIPFTKNGDTQPGGDPYPDSNLPGIHTKRISKK